jgi:hypothetical protein
MLLLWPLEGPQFKGNAKGVNKGNYGGQKMGKREVILDFRFCGCKYEDNRPMESELEYLYRRGSTCLQHQVGSKKGIGDLEEDPVKFHVHGSVRHQ